MFSIFLDRTDSFEQISNRTIVIGRTDTSGNEVSHTVLDGYGVNGDFLSSNTHST